MSGFGLNRRSVLINGSIGSVLPFTMTACSTFTEQSTDNPSGLDRLVNGPPGERVPAAGYVLMRNGQVLAESAVGRSSGMSAQEMDASIPERVFTTASPFRCASISKLATALTAIQLHENGVLSLDEAVANYLPVALVHPNFPSRSLTMRQLLSHTSGLVDPDVYWVAYPHSIGTILRAELFAPDHTPGEYFHYCNLNYGIAATAMERATGDRFDRLASALVITPLGLNAGLNWSGVKQSIRRNGATLYRETEYGWQIQTDGPDVLTESTPALLLDGRSELSTYTPGSNGTLFSPQGGLRASLRDLARLADVAGNSQHLIAPEWVLAADERNGSHDDRYFEVFGIGAHHHLATHSLWPGQRLIGHHGEAYGLYAGAFYAPDLDVSVSFAVTGTPEKPPKRGVVHPTLNRFTSPLLSAAIAAYEAL